MKKYAGDKKWTSGRSRVERYTNLNKERRGLVESLKIAMSHLSGSATKKRSWEK